MILEYRRVGETNRNTGFAEQFLEGTTIRFAIATLDQIFATATAAKTLATWKTDRNAKKIIPLFDHESLAIADTEDKTWEGRDTVYTTASGKKARTIECMIGVAAHRALKSYHKKKVRIYEFTDKQEILGTTPNDTQVKGQLVTLEVGKRVSAMPDKPAYTPVKVIYDDFTEFEERPVILRPDWSHIELQGIFDVKLVQVSATATSIKFQAYDLNGNLVTTLEDANVEVLNLAGAAYTHTFVEADEDGTYEVTGAAFANGFKIQLDGVVVQTEASYEGESPLIVAGIS